jgi:hypothetical protein
MNVFVKIVDNFFICFVLIFIALVQIYNSQFDRLTPWKGGGFGMFSTNKISNITAIGYTKSGDSVLIKVEGSKYDIPIPRNFLNQTKQFPDKKRLNRLATLIVNSYLKPSPLTPPQSLDKKSISYIKNNQKFYSKIYTPKYYQGLKNANLEEAITIQKVKVILYETDFYEQGVKVQKRYIGKEESIKF